VVVGWGPIGQKISLVLHALGMKVIAVRRSCIPSPPAIATVAYENLMTVLPRTDWLLLACPLSTQTRGLVSAAAFDCMPSGAQLVNVARGEVVDEAALISALQSGRLAGAYLDVFAHEPLAPESPLWDMPNVIVTPHSAGFSDGNARRVVQLFLDNLGRWLKREALFPQAT
jgi:phosphoglycerate dehydrogenase-like enzyme